MIMSSLMPYIEDVKNKTFGLIVPITSKFILRYLGFEDSIFRTISHNKLILKNIENAYLDHERGKNLLQVFLCFYITMNITAGSR